MTQGAGPRTEDPTGRSAPRAPPGRGQVPQGKQSRGAGVGRACVHRGPTAGDSVQFPGRSMILSPRPSGQVGKDGVFTWGEGWVPAQMAPEAGPGVWGVEAASLTGGPAGGWAWGPSPTIVCTAAGVSQFQCQHLVRRQMHTKYSSPKTEKGSGDGTHAGLSPDPGPPGAEWAEDPGLSGRRVWSGFWGFRIRDMFQLRRKR